MTFVESFSYLGACCSFNYNPKSQDSEDFFRTNSFGINGGLNVIGTGQPQASDGKSGAIYSEGFVVIVHHPNDFAVESASTTYLELGQETFIDVQPIHSSCSDQVLSLPFKQRKCIIPSDLKAQTYRQPECMLGCLRDEIHRRCHCHPFHLSRAGNHSDQLRDCKAKDVYCFVQNYCEELNLALSFVRFNIYLFLVEFKTVKCDHCFPSCSDIVYKTNSFKASFHGFNNSINPF